MPQVEEVQPESNYRLKLRFVDGSEGVLDLSDKVGHGVYADWTDKDIFESVRVTDSGNITWPNDVDMCADSLYLKITDKSPAEIFDSPAPKPKSA